MQRTFLVLFVLLSWLSLHAQEQEVDTLDHQKFLTLVNSNREQSYVTLGSGIGNLEPLLFEARLSPSYFFTGKESSWALILNPQVQVRMLNKPSFPIRNPSYHVSVNFYHGLKLWKGSFMEKLFYSNALWFASVNHHSNGQDGSYYIEDTTSNINFENASFATYSLELGISSYHLETLGKIIFPFVR